MRLRETLTNRQKIDLFNGQVVGIFPTMVLQEDAYYSKLKELCLGYYTARSAEKTISPTYENIINFVNENAEVNETADEIMGRLIRGKFLEKWTRVYEVLVSEQYNALHNMEITEHKDATNKDTDTYNTVKGKQGTNTDSMTYNSDNTKVGNNTDTTTFDTSVEDDGKTATSETTTRTVDGADNVYGFNSPMAVGDTTNVENVNETTVGEADKNTSHNLQTKTGTETKQFGVNETEQKRGTDSRQIGVDETETHTGTDTTDTIINENISKTGRDGSGAELIEKELNLRNTQIFFDIIYADIDSMTTLQIYI